MDCVIPWETHTLIFFPVTFGFRFFQSHPWITKLYSRQNRNSKKWIKSSAAKIHQGPPPTAPQHKGYSELNSCVTQH
ncbi:hypothetical protein SKAU_G00401410 [Synaphobranchus kaupii]|uniref:Uncharacterized protein n=1 Tax=Synaphobranchus kaupii TaxID=118154 RepID=A0A9Q1ICE6_SYNKA|nr:hypothetical protein SKAU_G00401410 [Synaphobranchus kaupii]